MKRTATALTIVIALLLSGLLGTLIGNLAHANPVVPADIEVYSPENTIYYSNEVEIGFIAPSRYNYPQINFTSFSYSLDGQSNVTISGNTTIAGLSWGAHSLVIYGEDTDGNTGSSMTVHFDVFFPITWIIIAITISTVVGMGLLVYFKKRKHQDISSSATSVNKLTIAEISTPLASRLLRGVLPRRRKDRG